MSLELYLQMLIFYLFIADTRLDRVNGVLENLSRPLRSPKTGSLFQLWGLDTSALSRDRN